MRITDIETVLLRLPNVAEVSDGTQDAFIVRVHTDEGIVGIGESDSMPTVLKAAIDAPTSNSIGHGLRHLLVGQNPLAIEPLLKRMMDGTRYLGGSGLRLIAISGLEMALWDIAGKATGRSLSTLLGGAQRSRVPVMASLDRYNDTAKVSARIAQALDARVSAVKVHEFDLDVIEAARRVAGLQIPFVADCNNAHTMADVQVHLARWQALDLLFLEDPAWPPEALLEAPPFPRVTVGLGADLGSAEQLAVYARAPSVGVLQPDICMIGGVSEARRAVALLASLGVAIAPHTPFIGPAALATLHILAAMKEVAYFAVIEAEPHMDMYGDSGFTRWQPDLSVPTGPGLGFDPDPAWLKRYGLDL